MNKTDKIYVAGHRGMVGSAIMRKLAIRRVFKYCYTNFFRTGSYEITNVNDFFEKEKPEYVFLLQQKLVA